MGLQIRDERQMKALTGLSQAQFDHLLPFFSAIYETTQQKTYAAGVASGTRRRKPGGGSKGKLPTMAEKLHEFIPLSFWYDAPLISRDRDRRHDPWLVYGSPSYSPAQWSSWISRA